MPQTFARICYSIIDKHDVVVLADFLVFVFKEE
jgi:hypothetical protein